jgi:hypothetical protein
MITAVGFQKMIATGVRMQSKNCLMRLALFLSGPSSLDGGIFYNGLFFGLKGYF